MSTTPDDTHNADAPDEATRATPGAATAAPDSAASDSGDAASEASDGAEQLDPDAPGAALVDPSIEQAEPNEPG